jgi:hypothetical protein
LGDVFGEEWSLSLDEACDMGVWVGYFVSGGHRHDGRVGGHAEQRSTSVARGVKMKMAIDVKARNG